ncbi:hypothetical protein TSOC_001286 [Tetrabaena socialis]|uniref:Uncharacterized protein n=1 Tax=Tetrabaena socialis TaxID=47790 RepID=A0A2J8AH68_9CHLO|nr:hypothetical protein TSOC_001286 [Tetrabaena socialis]|eukprot:PNH11873.1 hypothetical protein TSOC_001286 [Tetrabaena socialis]
MDDHVASAIRTTLAAYYGVDCGGGVDGQQQQQQRQQQQSVGGRLAGNGGPGHRLAAVVDGNGSVCEVDAHHAMLALCISPSHPPANGESVGGVGGGIGGGDGDDGGGTGGLPVTIAVYCKEVAVPPYGLEHAVQAAVMGRPRTLASAKASSWVAERRQYELSKPAEASEVLLSDADGRILEGLTTNFCVITVNDTNDEGGGGGGATLHACGPQSGVALPGVVQGRVLEAARRLGMRVVLAAPDAAERHTWSEAFISNWWAVERLDTSAASNR